MHTLGRVLRVVGYASLAFTVVQVAFRVATGRTKPGEPAFLISSGAALLLFVASLGVLGLAFVVMDRV